MSVSVSESGGVVTIGVSGRFDFSVHQDFMQSYRNIPKGQQAFVVDMSKTEYMDSSAMGMLLQLRDHASQSAKVKIINVNDSIAEILKIANFDKLFEIA